MIFSFWQIPTTKTQYKYDDTLYYCCRTIRKLSHSPSFAFLRLIQELVQYNVLQGRFSDCRKGFSLGSLYPVCVVMRCRADAGAGCVPQAGCTCTSTMPSTWGFHDDERECLPQKRSDLQLRPMKYRNLDVGECTCTYGTPQFVLSDMIVANWLPDLVSLHRHTSWQKSF